jgi:hypothetical protein
MGTPFSSPRMAAPSYPRRPTPSPSPRIASLIVFASLMGWVRCRQGAGGPGGAGWPYAGAGVRPAGVGAVAAASRPRLPARHLPRGRPGTHTRLRMAAACSAHPEPPGRLVQKVKEVAYVHCEGVLAGELKHGPLALVDAAQPVCLVMPRDGFYEARPPLTRTQRLAYIQVQRQRERCTHTHTHIYSRRGAPG